MSNPCEVPPTVMCINCKRIRRESNHWQTVRWDRWSFTSFPLVRSLQEDERAVCGLGCASAEYDRYLTQQRNNHL